MNEMLTRADPVQALTWITPEWAEPCNPRPPSIMLWAALGTQEPTVTFFLEFNKLREKILF